MQTGWLSTRGRRLAGLAAALVLGWFILDALIVTEKERLEERVQSLCRDFLAKKLDPCMAFVADDFADGGRDKASLRSSAESFLADFDPAVLTYSIDSIAVEGDRAEIFGVCFARPGPRSRMPSPMRGDLVLRLRRDAPPGREWHLVGLTYGD